MEVREICNLFVINNLQPPAPFQSEEADEILENESEYTGSVNQLT